MASHLHQKYKLNVHFPTAAINHLHFLYATEQRSGVCLLPTSPGNGNTHLFHCLEMLIAQNIYCFRDTCSSEAEFFQLPLIWSSEMSSDVLQTWGMALPWWRCEGAAAVAQESPQAAEQMLHCRTLADSLWSPSNQLLYLVHVVWRLIQ